MPPAAGTVLPAGLRPTCRTLPGLWLLLWMSACHATRVSPPPPAPPLSLIPAPAQLTPGKGSFVLTTAARVGLPQDAGGAAAGAFFIDLLARTRGLHLTPVSGSAGAPPAAVTFRLDTGGARQWPHEGYELTVSPRGITVTAGEAAGLLYGAVTLWQLATQAVTPASRIRIPVLRIEDAPRFPWRGLMLDSARHYQSPEVIESFLDWMALHKLNVLHWHLTDDQAWRLEIRSHPRLTGVGAWRVPAGHAPRTDIDPGTGHPRLQGGFYSQDTVRHLVAHAASRQITIVPEIEMPGHASAAIVAYPWLGVPGQPLPEVPSDWGVYPHLFNPTERTFDFLNDVLDEVVALFPGRYVHVGGDEAVKDQWHASAEVQARMRQLGIADEEKLQGYFMQRIQKALADRHRLLIGWDEIIDGGLPPTATVMSWRGIQGAASAARAGYDTVLTPVAVMYLDKRQGPGSAEPPGVGKVLSLEEVYRFEPRDPQLTPAEAQHVLGVQANLWTEHIRTPERLAYAAFPRAAAVAEIGWSPPAARRWEGFQERLPAQLARYRALNIPHAEEPLPPLPTPPGRLMSQELTPCAQGNVLSLEDDAPIQGPRAVFLIDILHPCWRHPAIDLSRPRTLTAAAGQVPFNFQIGKAADHIPLHPPRTPDGELEVRVDGCEGEPVGVASLHNALGNDAVTVLPSVPLPTRPGRHELCLTFTQRTLDPMWALDWVEVH